MPDTTTIPPRSEVPERDRWNLAAMYRSEDEWEEGLRRLEEMIPRVGGLKEGLGSSPDALAAALEFHRDYGLLEEELGCYASLRQSEDEGDTASRGRYARFVMAATRGQGAWSWLVPALQALPEPLVERSLADPRFAEFAVFLRKILRFKPHVLSEAEERLLALQAESDQTPREAFSLLTNVDLDFGTLDTPEGKRALSQSSFASFMRSPDRDLRRRAYFQFYRAFDGHRNTVAALLAGSVKLDKYRAEVRRFGSALEASLFPDDIPVAVYDNLVSTVSESLPILHDYYEMRRRALGLDELRHYDVYVPLLPEASSRHGYDEAVELVAAALAPLGEEYVATLRAGLAGDGKRGGWVDRYENKGKRSGAFSSGSYRSDPYILMNYKEDVIHDVFTLAHEGGHSMHSLYSARSNPFLSYGYTIFEAEVASTFNEELLFRHLYERAGSDERRAALLGTKLDDIIGTLFRQTMFAEFERRAHAMLEAGEPLTVDALRAEYRGLLAKYFGRALALEPESDLECLRIPHFYNAFYVYKYATGISASMALAAKVSAGGSREREAYFSFLRSGGSRFPIDSLKLAGVDMSEPGPVRAACAQFGAYAADFKRLRKL